MATYEKWEKVFASKHTYKDDIAIYFGNDSDAHIVWDSSNATLDVTGATQFTGAMAIEGNVTLVGTVTTTGETTKMIVDDPTSGGTYAFHADIGAGGSTGWTSGNVCGIRCEVDTTCTGTINDLTGGWFGLKFDTAFSALGTGMTCAISAEVESNVGRAANAILVLQSVPKVSATNFDAMPYIYFGEVLTAGTGSGVLFETDSVTTGSGKIYYRDTIHVVMNGDDCYIPLSTATGTFTYAYPILQGATGGDRLTQTYDGDKAIQSYTTCASTDGGTNWEPQRFDNEVTGAGGQVGCRFRVNLSTNVRLGGWANAFKAQVECNTDGGSTGLLSVGCFEMVFPKGNTVGAFSCIELEATTPSTGYTGATTLDSYIYCNCTGTRVAYFQDEGVLFHFDVGNAAGTGNLVGTGFSTVRCAFGQAFAETLMYIPMSSAAETFTTAYPIVSSSDTGANFTFTFDPDETYTDYAIAIGTEANDILISFGQTTEQNLDLIQMNIDVDSDASGTGPTGSSQMNLIHGYVTHDTDQMAYLRMKGIDMTLKSGANCKAVYAYQGEIELSATQTVTDEATVLGLVLNASGGTITGALRGMVIQMQGASLESNNTMGLFIHTATSAELQDGICIETNSGTTITNGIRINNASTGTLTRGINISHVGGTDIVTGIHLANCTTGINIASTCTTGITSAAPINITYNGAAFSITSVPAAAAVAQTISVNDTCSESSGRGIGLFVDYIANGTHTGDYGVRSTRVNTQILANVDSVICGDWYIHTISDHTIEWLSGLSMYWEDTGDNINNQVMIDLGKNTSAQAGGRDSFIRCREHLVHKTNSSILRLEGSSAADYLVWFDTGATGACTIIEEASHGTTPDYKIKCYIEGVGDRYIELHA